MMTAVAARNRRFRRLTSGLVDSALRFIFLVIGTPPLPPLIFYVLSLVTSSVGDASDDIPGLRPVCGGPAGLISQAWPAFFWACPYPRTDDTPDYYLSYSAGAAVHQQGSPRCRGIARRLCLT